MSIQLRLQHPHHIQQSPGWGWGKCPHPGSATTPAGTALEILRALGEEAVAQPSCSAWRGRDLCSAPAPLSCSATWVEPAVIAGTSGDPTGLSLWCLTPGCPQAVVPGGPLHTSAARPPSTHLLQHLLLRAPLRLPLTCSPSMAATPPERSPDLWSSILCLSDLSGPLPTTFPPHFFPPASRAEPRAGRRAGPGRCSGCPRCTHAASPHPPSCLCVRVAPSEQENPRTGRRGALNHSPGAGERGRRGERVARGEDMPPPHSQLGTVDFIYLFYSEIYQTWDWSLPEPGVCGTNPGPTYHLPKCNYQMR